MKISQSAQYKYRSAINKHANDAIKYVAKRIERETAELPVAEAREKAIEILEDSITIFGDRSQVTAATLFDEVCAAEDIDATSELFDDVIDPEFMRNKVAYYAGKLNEDDYVGFERSVSELGGYYSRRCAYSNMLMNCKKNNVRYARIPGGGETCNFCLMLASRGFVYFSEQTAYGKHGVHQHCDCVVIPGKKGRTGIDGYNPDNLYKLWKQNLALKKLGFTDAQTDALKAAYSNVNTTVTHPGLIADQVKISEKYDIAIKQAWNNFRKDKTPENYENTVNRFLKEFGKSFNADVSGEYKLNDKGKYVFAQPNGEELLAVQKMGFSEVKFLYADSYNLSVDINTNDGFYEIKTLESVRKTTNRLAKASKQFDANGITDKKLILSTMKLKNSDYKAASEVAQRFIDDETFNSITLIDAYRNKKTI